MRTLSVMATVRLAAISEAVCKMGGPAEGLSPRGGQAEATAVAEAFQKAVWEVCEAASCSQWGEFGRDT